MFPVCPLKLFSWFHDLFSFSNVILCPPNVLNLLSVFVFIFVVDAFSVNIVVVGIEACVLDILFTSNVNTWFSVG
jgi:hypothetical protein